MDWCFLSGISLPSSPSRSSLRLLACSLHRYRTFRSLPANGHLGSSRGRRGAVSCNNLLIHEYAGREVCRISIDGRSGRAGSSSLLRWLGMRLSILQVARFAPEAQKHEPHTSRRALCLELDFLRRQQEIRLKTGHERRCDLLIPD